MAIKLGKPSTSTFIDALIIAGIKTAEERLLAPFIGNGTFVSGAIKGGLAVGISALGGSNKWANYGVTAFTIDCAEDIVNNAIQYLGAGAGGNSGVVI